MDARHAKFVFDEEYNLEDIKSRLEEFGPRPNIDLAGSHDDDGMVVIIETLRHAGLDEERCEVFAIFGRCTDESSEEYHGATVAGWISAKGDADLLIFLPPYNEEPEEGL